MCDSARCDSLELNFKLLAGHVRDIEKRFETLNSPLWKRLLFRIDGWPAWHYVAQKPRWRPWHRWFRS